jgi:hypothetical protein
MVRLLGRPKSYQAGAIYVLIALGLMLVMRGYIHPHEFVPGLYRH